LTEDDAGNGCSFVSVELNDEEFIVEVVDSESFQVRNVVFLVGYYV